LREKNIKSWIEYTDGEIRWATLFLPLFIGAHATRVRQQHQYAGNKTADQQRRQKPHPHPFFHGIRVSRDEVCFILPHKKISSTSDRY